jgi:hypothetical protein
MAALVNSTAVASLPSFERCLSFTKIMWYRVLDWQENSAAHIML